MSGSWPFVGRVGELQRLEELLARSGAQGLVLAGPAGVGKTRLALEGLRLAEQAGWATARVTATQSAARLPFGALAPLLPAELPAGELGPNDPGVLLRRYAESLVRRSPGQGFVLLVDDAHLLDYASATLVHQLAASTSVFVLLTVRFGEQAPDPIVALWKDGVVERMDLVGLRVEVLHELISSVLGGSIDPAAASHLAVRCQGNVLLLRELVLGALQDGSLVEDGGFWYLRGPLSPSDRLAELVEVRLGSMAAEERALLELVALGEPLGPAELASLGYRTLAGNLERGGLLQSRRDGRRLEVRLAHPAYGDVLRARIPPLDIPAVVRSLAELVEGTGARRREDVLRVATWRLEGGGAKPQLMLEAAKIARWRYDFPLAERLAQAALDAGAGFEAAFLAAQLSALQGRGVEAERQLAELAQRAVDDTQRGLVAVTRVENSIHLGDLEEGLRSLDEADLTVRDQEWRDEMAVRRSTILMATGGPRAGTVSLEPLLQRIDGRALAWACQIASHGFGRQGRLADAIAIADRGFRVQVTLQLPLDWYPWMHLFHRCEALAHAGRILEAEEIATAQYQQGLDDHSAEAQAWFAWQLSRVFTRRGHTRRAVRHGQEAVALFRQFGWPQFVQMTLDSLALAYALAGDGEAATATISAIDELALPKTVYLGTEPHIARAWTAATCGDLPLARDHLKDAAALGSEIGDLVGRAAALYDLARLGRPKDVVPDLKSLAQQIEGELIATQVAHVEALARNDRRGLEAAARAFEAMGADLFAAEAAAMAAKAWQRAGSSRTREAAMAATQARLLADRCQGAHTPALEVLDETAHLSPSEREAALLAASGYSNKEIAEKLFLSVRTVENRLQRVYEKLGVAGRAELDLALLGGSRT